jgi:hypothetical protein
VKEHGKQDGCVSSVTLLGIPITNVANENVKILFLFIVFGIDVALNNINMVIVAMEMQQCVYLHCCQGTIYFIFLLTVISMKWYSLCVCIFLLYLSRMQMACFMCCLFICGLSGCTIFFHIRFSERKNY